MSNPVDDATQQGDVTTDEGAKGDGRIDVSTRDVGTRDVGYHVVYILENRVLHWCP